MQVATVYSLRTWAVHAMDPVWGVGKRLATIEAPDRATAELMARGRFGSDILVTVAGGRARRKSA